MRAPFDSKRTEEETSPRNRDTRILAVDDSSFFTKAIRRSLSGVSNLRVVGTAKNGREALSQISLLRPNIVTLDIEMPVMDGLQTLKMIRQRNLNVKVIMVSALTEAGAEKTMEALELGASDFITKPSSEIAVDKVEYLRTQLVRSIANLGVNRANPRPPIVKPTRLRPTEKRKSRGTGGGHDIVAIAVSTGGPRALVELVKSLPSNFQGSILIAQHMPALFTKTLAQRLNRLTSLTVKEGEQGESVSPGHIYLAPGGFHMEVRGSSTKPTLQIHEGPRLHGCRPAADHLLSSAAATFGPRCQGVVMTGMGLDGTDGCKAIVQAGGCAIGQDEASSAVWGMPKAAYEAGYLEELYPLHRLARAIARRAERTTP